eukprot:scaffold1637_cov410-Prasinococcus_capsulatus_cf.AAC.38
MAQGATTTTAHANYSRKWRHTCDCNLRPSPTVNLELLTSTKGGAERSHASPCTLSVYRACAGPVLAPASSVSTSHERACSCRWISVRYGICCGRCSAARPTLSTASTAASSGALVRLEAIALSAPDTKQRRPWCVYCGRRRPQGSEPKYASGGRVPTARRRSTLAPGARREPLRWQLRGLAPLPRWLVAHAPHAARRAASSLLCCAAQPGQVTR